jgi:hypothetical protein
MNLASYDLEKAEKSMLQRTKGGTFTTKAKYLRFSEFLASTEQKKVTFVHAQTKVSNGLPNIETLERAGSGSL